MGRRLGLGIGIVAGDEKWTADIASSQVPSCPAGALLSSLPRWVLRTRARTITALLLLLLALSAVLEEAFNAEDPRCQCDTHECFLTHKQEALRGAVARARRKCVPIPAAIAL